MLKFDEDKKQIKIRGVKDAIKAYALCERFILSTEATTEKNKGIYDTSIYDSYQPDFDYFTVGYVLSGTQRRRQLFIQYVVDETQDKEERNKRSYDWLMLNVCFENYTMFVLEQWWQHFVEGDDNALCWKGFEKWIDSCRNENGFTFHLHNQNKAFIVN
jgi:hypothetical protein